MNNVMSKFLGLIILCGLSFISSGKDNVREILNAENTQFSYFVKKSRDLNIAQVESLPQDKWITSDSFTPYGLVNKNYWLHFSLTLDNSIHDKALYLEVSNPLIDQLEVYFIRGEQRLNYIGGDMVPTSSRVIVTPMLYFPLPNGKSKRLDVYVKYQDQAASFLPLAITNSKDSFEKISNHGIFSGIIIGLLALLLLINTLLYQSKKQESYHYFAGFILVGGTTILALEGIASIYFWPSWPWLQNQLLPSLFLLTVWFSIQLTRQLSQQHLKKHPGIKATLKWLAFSLLVLTPILFALPAFIAGIVSVVCLCIAMMIMSGTLVLLALRTRVIEPLLIGSWAAFIISLILMTIYYAGIIAMPPIVLSVATVSYCLQFVLWGCLLIRRFIRTNEVSTLEQHLQIDELKEQYNSLESSMSEQQEDHLDLEAQVNERTFELSVALRELQEINRQLEEQATNDALTGVKNRKFFDERLLAEYRLSRRQQTPLSLLLLDADKFKLVNDNHGHLAGDKVLIDISKIANKLLKRPNDYVCRYGGEEFAILLSNTDQKGALKMAEVIRQKIASAKIQTEKVDLQVTVSIGVSTMLVGIDTKNNQLFAEADQALYHAKESGRNNVKTFEDYTNSSQKL